MAQYPLPIMCSEGYDRNIDYKIRITNTVENDLDLVTGYITEILHNPTAAEKTACFLRFL